MKLGLIGYPLGHSWSPAIHANLLKEDCYSLCPLKEDELESFMKSCALDGFNVTIPYKQSVMAYLDEIDEAAKQIGAVNTVVHKNGKFTGYNTDYEGFLRMVEENGISLSGNHAAILGSGGASKAIQTAVKTSGGTFEIVSRNASDTSISYEQLYQREAQFQILINATPVGMSPNEDAVPVDLDRFSSLKAVVDVIANPLRTDLCFKAKEKGIKSCGGFEMLVRQALAADRYFTGKDIDEHLAASCMNDLLKERRSIVLIGMPTSGKTTIAAKIAEKTGRPLVEMDEVLVKRFGMPIADVFAQQGESVFRDAETKLSKELTQGNAVISCGGGIIKNRENMKYLSRNGLVFWIDRDIDLLFGTSSRPLSKSKEDIKKLYEERKDLYQRYSDIRIENNGSLEAAVEAVLSVTGEL